ncbi:MAG TPA: alkaline phosphatase family protein [Terracidiphilus sp.]|nr:alkaline phosphatase family protein [Terracidiphilus sp.]
MLKSACSACCVVLALALCSCGSYKRGFSPTAPTPSTPPASLSSIKHIIVLVQENRSLDSYFGAMRQYWAQNQIPDESFDGLPQFNPTSGQAPLQGIAPTNPGCNPANPSPSDCLFDTAPSAAVTSYHLQTMCVENPSPSWNEAHADWDYNDQVGNSPPTLNGFVWSAAHDARVLKYYDQDGLRAMGYYDGSDLNYYYYMASYFATSDRWFQPVLSRTQINRAYLFAATSQGRVYPNNTDSNDSTPMTAKTIFQDLQDAGITWKIYENPVNTGCSGPPYDPACLMKASELYEFAYAQTIVSNYPQNIVPISQYFTDLQNGTLPQVAYIDPATDAGFDEHPTVNDAIPSNIQYGANYVSSLINALMSSSSWQNSVFILTWDESGGFYDHVSPQPAVSPDGIKPSDLEPGDTCTQAVGPTCDFTYTGYRVPLIVISPFVKKHYVSHTVADYTAILKFIEKRFNVPALTKRDAAQMDMTEFFDFQNPPWMTPPSNPPPPVQNTKGACYVDHLP